MNKKVFIFDLDQTLLNNEKKIQKCHIDALIKAKTKGHQLVLCSGRTYQHIISILKQLPENLFRYLICNNGCYIYDLKTGNKIIEKSIDFSILETFEKIGKKYKTLWGVHTLNFSKRGCFWKNQPKWFKNVFHEEWDVSKFVNFKDVKHLFKEVKISQLTWRSTKEIVNKMIKEVKEKTKDYNHFISGEIHIDILPKGVSKFTGIVNLCKILNASINSCIAFGDSGNDIEMLEGVGYGIALENGTKEAKKAADLIIGNNNTCAIANKVLELI